MLTIEEITRFMQEDASSELKRMARVGERYYEGAHDIRNYKLYYIDAEGKAVEDKTRSNIRISHPFFTELVDQEVQYMLSDTDGFAESDDPDLQDRLDEYFNTNESFMSELYDMLTDTIATGSGYMYAYKDENGRTAFQCAGSIGVIEVRAKDTQANTDHVIYWYVDRVQGENGYKKIKRIQVWDENETSYYVSEDDGTVVRDEEAELNPRPHTVYVDEKGQRYGEGFGFVPFFRLDNNRRRTSGLWPIKEIIDDYDLISCGLTNNIQDFADALYVVAGFQGDNLDELMQNMKVKKAIGVDDNGSVDIKTVDIPVEARQAKLDLDEKNIYRFGMGFNSAQLGDGNITNIVIKSRYALLDLKCNKLEIRLKRFLRQILRVVLDEINEDEGTDYRLTDVRLKFDREVMTNALDNAQIELVEAQTQQAQINTLLSLVQTLDDETVIRRICDVLDIDYDDVRDRMEEEKASQPDPMAELMASPTTEEGAGEPLAEAGAGVAAEQ